MLLWVDACSSDLAENRLFATVDGFVLVIHDRTSSGSRVISQVAGESGNGWDHDDDPELPSLLAGTNASISNCATDLVVHGSLILPGSGNEELVLDVNIVLRATNHLAVSVLNALLGENATGPVSGAANQLRVKGPVSSAWHTRPFSVHNTRGVQIGLSRFAARCSDHTLLVRFVACVVWVLLVVDGMLFNVRSVVVLTNAWNVYAMFAQLLLVTCLGMLIVCVAVFVDPFGRLVPILGSRATSSVGVDWEDIGRLQMEWGEWVVDVVTHWMLGSLHADEVLVFTSAS